MKKMDVIALVIVIAVAIILGAVCGKLLLDILLNGVLLTAQTSVSPRIGSECTLSDILIADCPAKYILSEKAHIQILSSLFPDAKVSVYIPPMEPPYV